MFKWDQDHECEIVNGNLLNLLFISIDYALKIYSVQQIQFNDYVWNKLYR